MRLFVVYDLFILINLDQINVFHRIFTCITSSHTARNWKISLCRRLTLTCRPDSRFYAQLMTWLKQTCINLCCCKKNKKKCNILVLVTLLVDIYSSIIVRRCSGVLLYVNYLLGSLPFSTMSYFQLTCFILYYELLSIDLVELAKWFVIYYRANARYTFIT